MSNWLLLGLAWLLAPLARHRERLAIEREQWIAGCDRIALSWLMMMYARAPEGRAADAKLEACYHKLHFGEWPSD